MTSSSTLLLLMLGALQARPPKIGYFDVFELPAHQAPYREPIAWSLERARSTDSGQRYIAARLLGDNLADLRAVGALMRLAFEDPDESVSFMAAGELRRLDTPHYYAELARRLPRLSTFHRGVAEEAIGKGYGGFPVLKRLSSDANAGIRQSALTHIGALKGPREPRLSFLVSELRTSSADDAHPIMAGLSIMGAREAVPYLTKILHEVEAKDRRKADAIAFWLPRIKVSQQRGETGHGRRDRTR